MIQKKFVLIEKILVFLLFLIFFLYTNFTFSLEITLNLYDPLSKSFSTPIPGTLKTIINKDKIQNNKILPIHKIIEMESGINTRSIYGDFSSGSKTTIDIRGMGAQAKSNVLILINGQRLNNIDMSEIDFPSIPLDSIEKIEILKGNSASVLYGDGAIGGAINFITNNGSEGKNYNELTIKTGSFNSKSINYNFSDHTKYYSITSSISNHVSDGYRDENEQLQNNFSSDIKYRAGVVDHNFSLNFNEQIMSTPSDRSQIQLYSDRRGSDTPDDFINSLGASLMYASDYKLNNNSSLIISSSIRIKDSYSDLQSTSYPSYNDTSLFNYQFSPRVKKYNNIFNNFILSTIGLDLQYATYESFRKESKNVIPLHTYNAWQSTQSIYTQNSININEITKLGFGVRFQRNIIGIGDKLNTQAPDYAGWQTEHSTFKDESFNYSTNIGLERKFKNNITLFGRIGNGFRYPNIDDRIGGSGDSSFSLKTQKSTDLEIGTKINKNESSYILSSYIIKSDNELGYDADNFVNININSTERFGLELETNNLISQKIKLTNNFSFSKAKYTSGNQGTYAKNFEGKDVPLVPQFTANSNLEMKISNLTKIVSTFEFQDDMRMESDDENFQDIKIPSYFLSHLNINYRIQDFNCVFSINNIFNEKYYNYAVASSSSQGVYNAYPEPGRAYYIYFEKKF